MKKSDAQHRINDIQATYRQWLALQQKLQQAEQDWEQSVKLMEKMQQFYFDGDYRSLLDQLETGKNLDLTTEGEYSVMGEDTIWNAIHEQDQALWRMMRFAIKHLDKT